MSVGDGRLISVSLQDGDWTLVTHALLDAQDKHANDVNGPEFAKTFARVRNEIERQIHFDRHLFTLKTITPCGEAK